MPQTRLVFRDNMVGFTLKKVTWRVGGSESSSLSKLGLKPRLYGVPMIRKTDPKGVRGTIMTYRTNDDKPEAINHVTPIVRYRKSLSRNFPESPLWHTNSD